MVFAHQITGEFRPLQDWVILAPEKKAEAKGGVIIPENARTFQRCRVVAVGPGFLPYSNGVYGKAVIPTELKVGEVVWLEKFVEGEMKFRLNGEIVFAIRERHLNVKLVA